MHQVEVATTQQSLLDAPEMTLNMGPQHPSTHGVLRVVLKLDGETVIDLDCDIGYLHRGMEKIAENRMYTMIAPYWDRLDYIAAVSNGLVWVETVEQMLGLDVPRRAHYMRTILTELNRIASHLLWLGTHALDIGAVTILLWAFREREEILKIFELVAGQRMMTSYIRIGGLALEPPAGWLQAVDRFVKMMPSRIDEYENLLTGNRIWIGRTKDVGYISAEDAVALSMTGPTLRAAGLAYDNRRFFPYSSYEEFEFDVPTRTDSDCFGRYMIRVAEMRESLKIIRQAMGKIPAEGAVRAEAPGVVPPEREKMKTEMEALIYHFKIVTEGFAVPEGEVYQAVESPRGEMGYYVVSDGSAKPYRVHMRSACLANMQTLPKMCEGRLLADVVAAIGSIDIVLGEIDR